MNLLRVYLLFRKYHKNSLFFINITCVENERELTL